MKQILGQIMLAAVVSLVASELIPSASATQPLDATAETSSQLVAMIEGDIDGGTAVGAGIVVGADDTRIYIVTANHVVRRNGREVQRVRVRFKMLPDEWLDAGLTPDAEVGLDVAVLAVERRTRQRLDVCRLPFDRLGRPETLKRGQAVFPVGYPTGVPWGMPVSPDRVAQIVGRDVTFESPFIRPGHSGGALLTDRGEVVGLIRQDQDPPFAVAVTIDRVLDTLRKWGYPTYLHVRFALHDAVRKGDAVEVRRLLSACAKVNEKRNGLSPLHFAAWDGNARIAELLLTSGADVRARVDGGDYHGETALHLAAMKNLRDVARVLIARGADVNAEAIDHADWTPLNAAVRKGAVDTATLLLEHGGDPNKLGGSDAYLYTAVDQDNLAMVLTLLEHGADVTGKDASRPPLEVAAKKGAADIVAALLKHGADVKRRSGGETPLAQAVIDEARSEKDRARFVRTLQILLDNGADARTVQLRPTDSPEIANVLLAHGANVNQDGLLCSTITDGSMELLGTLLAHRPDVNRESTRDNGTPLVCAAYAGKPDAVKALIKAGAKANQANSRGMSPLVAAIRGIQWAKGPSPLSASLEIVEALLRAGSAANAVDPLDVLQPRYLSILEVLLAHGGDPNRLFDNERGIEVTPLQYAAERGDLDAVKVLLQAKANPNVPGERGDTPLHGAVDGAKYALRQYGAPPTSTFVDVMRLLLQAGANVNARGRFGTPLSYTVGNASKIPEIVEVLRANGGTE